MSAYIVDRKHILYLVNAAMSRAISRHTFSWYVGGDAGRRSLPAGDYETAAEVANMLWRENIASVSARYPNESSGMLPGPIDERFTIDPVDIKPSMFAGYEVAQVLKACDCYEYQSCEHEGWKDSESKSFIDSLRSAAWHSLPGYEKAEWGAPPTLAEARAAYRAGLVNQ